MSLSSLQVLANNREALLLAETIGWLHDYRKCSEEHLQAQAPGSRTQALPRTQLAQRQPTLQGVSLVLPTIQQSRRTVAELLDDRTWNQDTLGQFLSRCHNTAHFDKQEPVGGGQAYPGTRISSAFGFEESVGTNLTNSLWRLPWSKLTTVAADRHELRERIGALFSTAIADSRRPINEVDLWSWGSFVSALYKAALAGALLSGTTPASRDLQWRLLGIRVDGLEYISNVARIPDLLARQQLLTDALDQVRTLLEVEYPLGSEVYRDQNGSIFIVPDVPDLLDMTDKQRITLREQIAHAFAKGTLRGRPDVQLGGEVLPTIMLEPSSWWGQDPNWSGNSPTATNDKLPNIKGMLTAPLITQADAQTIESLWQDKTGNWGLCPVCRLRPKEESQEACETCERRRGSRIADWEKNPAQTIWMDELADHNDRVALLVGKFGLDDWLSGDLVQTMLVRADPQKNDFTPKNPSPARLRRVWETCERFWTETVEQQILAPYPYGEGTKNAELRRVRWLVIPDKKNGWQENVPYDGTVNGKPISLLWREEAKHFVTISNLQWAGTIENGQTVVVSDPDEPQRTITFTVQGTMQAMNGMGKYSPYLSLLTSPDQFLALVPAHDALAIADQIRAKYQEQFGKVQNRLPLFLGLVFFPRKMPLAAVMDTARRMLAVPVCSELWTVKQFANDTLTFESGVEWTVPTTMGDGSEDKWYPYFQVEQFADGTPDNRPYRFQHDGHWFVHVKDLQKDDLVTVTPSHFAYLWLEHTARRFEFDAQKDVMLLDELPRLMEMWEKIRQTPEMTDTKLRGVQALLEAKGAEWGGTSDEFQNLARTTLGREKMLSAVALEDVTSGRFAHCLELYIKILKRKVKED